MPKTTPDATRQAQRAAEARARQVPLPAGLDPDTVGTTAAPGSCTSTGGTTRPGRRGARSPNTCTRTARPAADRRPTAPNASCRACTPSKSSGRSSEPDGWRRPANRGRSRWPARAATRASRPRGLAGKAARVPSLTRNRNTSASTHRAHEHERETRTRARAVSRANPANHRGATRVAHARETAGFRGPCETHRESRETPVRNPAKLDAA